MTNQDDDVRRGSARVFRESGIAEPTIAVLINDDDGEEGRSRRLSVLLADTAQRQATVAALSESVWDEDDVVAWRAAKTLIDEGCSDTPGVVQALVRVGFASEALRAIACEHVHRFLDDPRLTVAVRGALLEALRGDSGAVATTCALVLTDRGDARGNARVSRITRALLRDSKQAPEALPRLRQLLTEEAATAAVKAIGDYMGSAPVDETTAATCAELLVAAGQLGSPHLAKVLVLNGLAHEGDHERIIGQLTQLLDDPKLVTNTRKALSEGLSSENTTVAWGAARCLWEVGSRVDNLLPSALIRSGLGKPLHRDVARSWLLELLALPRTAAKALPALEEAADQNATLYGGDQDRLDLAWEIGHCLLSARIFDADNLAEAVVRGGLARRERHDEVVRVARELLTVAPTTGRAIEKELWSCVEWRTNNNTVQRVVAAGAARVLIEAEFPSIRDVMATGAHENEKRAVALIKTLLGLSEDDPFGTAALVSLTEATGSKARAREALRSLLKDDDRSIAYGAARCLVRVGDLNHRHLPGALIRGGLPDRQRRDETAGILDRLRAQPLAEAAVQEALQQAIWSDDEQRACAAAVYLMDRGHGSEAGVARGLIFGGMFGHDQDDHVDMRVWTLAQDPASRSGIVNALRALLLGEERGHMLNVAAMLVVMGESLSERLLGVFDSDFAVRHSPIVPLAAFALSGRIAEAREQAETFGLQRILALLDEKPLDVIEVTG